MPRNYDHVLSFVVEHPWALTRPMLQVIAGALARHVAGVDIDQAALDAALVNRKNLPQPRAGSIAIIPVYGVIAPRMNAFTEMSGGTTFETLTGQLREVVANKTVQTIVFDVNSPGGNVAGATEFADEVRRARSKKAVVAVAQYTMASAAYWAMSGATQLVAAPSAHVGSVGIFTVHNDLSAALEQLGVKRTYISAGAGKVDGHEAGPLSEETTGRIQALVDSSYDTMVKDILRGRGTGTSTEKIRNEWQAHVYTAPDALRLGLVDRIETLDATIERLLSASSDPADAKALAALHGDTDQEPQPATSQDLRADDHQLDLEQQLFELQLSALTIGERP